MDAIELLVSLEMEEQWKPKEETSFTTYFYRTKKHAWKKRVHIEARIIWSD